MTRFEPEISTVCMVAHPLGRFILYADAEKWVQEEIDERDRTISRLNNNLCDRGISLEAALKLCKGKDEEIKSLTKEIEINGEAWKIAAKVIEDQNGLLAKKDEEIAALKEKINQTVIAKP